MKNIYIPEISQTWMYLKSYLGALNEHFCVPKSKILHFAAGCKFSVMIAPVPLLITVNKFAGKSLSLLPVVSLLHCCKVNHIQ